MIIFYKGVNMSHLLQANLPRSMSNLIYIQMYKGLIFFSGSVLGDMRFLAVFSA